MSDYILKFSAANSEGAGIHRRLHRWQLVTSSKTDDKDQVTSSKTDDRDQVTSTNTDDRDQVTNSW